MLVGVRHVGDVRRATETYEAMQAGTDPAECPSGRPMRHSFRRSSAVMSSAAPFDPVRVVEEIPGVVEAGPPQEFDEVLVAVCEADGLPVDGDTAPARGERPWTTIGALIPPGRPGATAGASGWPRCAGPGTRIGVRVVAQMSPGRGWTAARPARRGSWRYACRRRSGTGPSALAWSLL